ncbi:MAG TPA: hypothetical protein VHD15_14590, partial [Hyphomicrobiales bacterium]|nr:hypothetical protein [Hyphomicrobiales bacterium]
RVPQDREPYVQDSIPYWWSPVKDEATGRWITSHIMNQDFVAWVGQGAVTDRGREHLGQSDRGIVMMRRRLQQQIEALAGGSNALKAVIRDPVENECLKLPIVDRDILIEGLPRDAFQAAQAKAPRQGEFPFLVGQPPEIRAAWREAMGLAAD